jgi:hypothetical protein
MKVHSAHKSALTQPSAGAVSETATGERTQPPEIEFEEPAAAEDREDLDTNVAPSRFDAPIDPHAPTRSPSPQVCGLPDEHRPEPGDFDGTA